MKINIQDKIVNPLIEGHLIFCFRKIREVALIELRNGFENEIDDASLLFYINKMENSIVTKNINLERFERVKKISKYYVEYEIGYSVSDQIEIKAEIKGKYDYVLISHVDDIVTSYQGVVRDFYNKSKSGIVCKIKDIPDLLEIYKEDYFSLEIGELV